MAEKVKVRKLEPEERETIIIFDRAGDTAEVFTYERTWQTHCEKILGLKPAATNSRGGKSYEMPKTWIRKPRKSRRKADL
jgi:hypothetical protein